MYVSATLSELIAHIEKQQLAIDELKAQVEQFVKSQEESNNELKGIKVKVIWPDHSVEERPWNNLRGLQKTTFGKNSVGIERPRFLICDLDPNKIKNPALKGKILSQFRQHNVYVPV